MGQTEDLFAVDPATRLAAARRLSARGKRRSLNQVGWWPAESPGARNAWLLFVTTKPTSWRDPLIPWPEGGLTLGEPHDGFLYPDPIGFWTEVRRWSIDLLRVHQPTWSTAECLALTALVHVGDEPQHLRLATSTCLPCTTVFLDEPAWRASGLELPVTRLAIPDPHRSGQLYEGWWATTAEGPVVGKAPQHPTMHRLYRAHDLTGWLQAAPVPRRVTD